MTVVWTPKDPDEVLDYQLNWAARLDGDTISGSTFTVPDGLTLDTSSYSSSATTAWLSGGELGETYSILNRVTTAGGRTFDQTVRLPIRSK